MHSLIKSGIFFTVGQVSQVKGTQRISQIRGLTESNPLLGWTLVVAVIAIAGLPPFGVFMSEFLIVTATLARQPLLALPLVVGLLVGFGALTLRLHELAFGKPEGTQMAVQASYLPVFAHLAPVLVAGVYLPAPLVAWFRQVAAHLG
jgi:hydrogenase-4 component F